MRILTSFRLLPLIIAACITLLLVTSPGAMAQKHDSDDMGPDEAGSEETLNSQLWEYMRHTPYSDAKLYVSSARAKARPAIQEVNSLPTGWSLSPAGTQIEVGRLPCEAVAYAGSLVVLNNGFYGTGPESPEVSIVDLAANTVRRSIRLESLFPSAVASPDGDLYISGGISRKVFRLNRSFDTVKVYPIDGYVGGLAAVDVSHIAVASLVTAATTADFKQGNYGAGRISIVNTISGAIEQTVDTGYFPYALTLTNGKIYASLLGEDKVKVVDSHTLKPLKVLAVGQKPQNMAAAANRLYVINSGSDSISVIDTMKDEVTATFTVRNKKTDFGAAPVSCAADETHKRLYVALANANQAAVLDLDSGKRLGSIPTGWYPTKALLTGDSLVILNGKGIRSRRPNVNGPQPAANRGGPEYVLTLLKGSVQNTPLNDLPSHLTEWTRTAESSSPESAMEKTKISRQPIKHIFYIVRENRTYDQVLGDITKANGDPNLTLFGREITPNGHSIADQFVTLDNYFADGEISVLGHSFTTSGYASPFLEWLANASYSGRYNGYPFGMVPAATSPAYLWDALDKKGVDYRIYGENYYLYTRAYDILRELVGPENDVTRKFYAQMMHLASQTDRGAAFYAFASPYYGKADTPEAAFALLSNQAFVSAFSQFLCGDDSLSPIILIRDDVKAAFASYLAHYPFNYRSWDLKFSDLDRAKVWKEDFEKQVKAGKVASLQYLWLPNDHTGGTNKSYLPPDQLVSENDAALGYILETISHSPIWKQSLILVTEDDAQNGPDHVDATRTVALAAGPSIKRGTVISDRFDQLSLLRTIGLLLGVPPLNQNDALAAPMFSIFAPKADNRTYEAIEPMHLTDADDKRFKSLKRN